jgi:3-deoxy-D-manno-octulosonic-acid transferase
LFQAIDAWTFVDSAAAGAWEPYIFGNVRGLVAGDPRVDRALARVEAALTAGKARETLSLWRRKEFCLVAGSTWPEDEKVLLQAWSRLTFPRSLVLVPHEPEENHLLKIEKHLGENGLRCIRYSRLKNESEADVLLVDQRGVLAELYGLGRLAYVGGGFGRHIHSIVEPVAHGLPVAFGPHYRRSPEAFTLCAAGSALALPGGSARELADWIQRLKDPGEERDRALEPIRIFLQIHRGAGARVAEFLENCLQERSHG